MKKVLKLFCVSIIILGVVFAFSGCGDKGDSTKSKNENSNENSEEINVSKEKVIHGEYIRGGGYDSSIEMTFSEDNKLTKMVLIYDCATEKDAETFYNNSLKEVAETVIKIDGKKVTVTMNASEYMSLSGLTEDKLDEGTMRQVAMGMGYNMKD